MSESLPKTYWDKWVNGGRNKYCGGYFLFVWPDHSTALGMTFRRKGKVKNKQQGVRIGDEIAASALGLLAMIYLNR